MGHVPLRMCIACREMKPKNELIRVVRDMTDGTVRLDEKSRLFGRGAYVCRDARCTALAKKKKGFERHFKCRVEPEIYEQCTRLTG